MNDYRIGIKRNLLGILLLSYTFPFIAFGHDHPNLEEGIPLDIEDPYAAGWLNREFQVASYFERTAEGTDLWLVEPRLEFGLPFRNMETKLSFPTEFGSAVDEEGLRNVGLEWLYTVVTESKLIPGTGLSAKADFPTGNGPEGVDTTLKFIATKAVFRSTLLQRVYYNLAWTHNDEPKAMERDSGFKHVVGYGMRLGPDTFLLADYIHEEEIESGRTSNIAEVGLRRMITPLLVMGVGAGFGLDDESPDFRIRFGIQKMF